MALFFPPFFFRFFELFRLLTSPRCKIEIERPGTRAKTSSSDGSCRRRAEKMGFTVAPGPVLFSSNRRLLQFDHCYLISKKQRFLVLSEAQKNYHPLVMKPIKGRVKSNISNSDEGASKPAEKMQETVISEMQRLEEKLTMDSTISEDAELNMNHEALESNFQVALSALMQREWDLQDVEKRVLLDHERFNHTKQELQIQEKDIAMALAKQQQMEEDLRKANDDLASQAKQIKDLKLLVEKQEKKIASSRPALMLKEDELERLRKEVMKKDEEAATMSAMVDSRNQLLFEANRIIKEQEARIKVLERDIGEKECDLADSLQLKNEKEGQLKLMVANLEKQALEWLIAQEELEKLKAQASKNMNDVEETSEEFERVRALLADVKYELISAQESFASSRVKVVEQAQQIERQLADLNEHKVLLASYMQNLKDAQLELETERSKLAAAETQSKELEMQLSENRKLVECLQDDLTRERAAVEHGAQEVASIQNVLLQKEKEHSIAQAFLQLKESELAQAKLQIHQMEYEKESLQLISQGKDADLEDARNKLITLRNEVSELQQLMDCKDDELIEATRKLLEKEEHVVMVQNELDDTKQKFSEATSIVGRIASLTDKLVTANNEDDIVTRMLDEVNLPSETVPNAASVKQKQIEAELLMTKELLREKDEKHRAVLERWGVKEEEMERREEELRENIEGLEKLYSLAQGGIGDKTMQDFIADKLQLEAAQLEAKAATTALRGLSELSEVLLEQSKASTIIGEDEQTDAGPSFDLDKRTDVLKGAEKEVTRLLALTEKLVKELR